MGKKNRNKRELRQTSVNVANKVDLRNNVKENVPIKGLHNLGNTCYLNAALQCLARSPWLLDLLIDDEPRESTLTKPDGDSVSTLCISLPPMKCTLTTQFKELICNMKPTEASSTKINSSNSISPGMFRNVFVERCPRFGGFRQHDSHELIRSLLDCLKQEELTRWKKGILLKLNVNPKDVRDDEKESIRNWGKAASIATAIDRLFGGILISTIECCCCGTIRPRFEPFLDLSLSVSETSVSKCNHSESMPERNSKGAYSAKQLRKKERKRKTPKQRKHQSFLRDDVEHQSDQDCSDSDRHKSQHHNNLPVDSFIAKCCADVTSSPSIDDDDDDDDSKHQENVMNGDVDVEQEEEEEEAHQHDGSHGDHDGDGDDDDVDCCENNVINLNGSSAHSSETLNQDYRDEVASSDGNCADTEEGSDLCDSVTSSPSHRLISNHSNDHLNEEQSGVVQTTCDLLEKLHLNSVTPSPSFSCHTSELTQAIHYARIPLNEMKNSNSILTKSIGIKKNKEQVISIYECLSKYTSTELLTGSNRLICDICTKRNVLENSLNSSIHEQPMTNNQSISNRQCIFQDVIKRDLIYKPPAILMIHLKRFQQIGVQLRKSQKSIKFPIDLDITPFCSGLALTNSNRIHYHLYGVIEHTGHLNSGHYVAYVNVPKSSVSNDQLTVQKIQLFIGSLHQSPKWPLSINDLIQRFRRCDHYQQLLLPSSLSSSSITNHHDVDNMNKNSDVNNNHSTGCNSDDGDADDDDDEDVNVDENDAYQWFYCSDSHVTRVSQSTVLNCQAYILFYERIE
ncbi:unnamed protein product [Schistosoma turkestanicum]|nr:unnamed protein product [Schistosoma turkestanicum]